MRNRRLFTSLAAGTAVLCLLGASPHQQQKVGYDDTPFLPDSKWRVHDGKRPQPRLVNPGPTAAAPPSDAVVLFDGSDLSAWKGRRGPAKWKVEGGYMEVNRTGGIQTKEHFGDCQLHVEWMAPSPVNDKKKGQGRGNSGVFFFGSGGYEIQVLDSFENPTYPDGQAAALYGQYPPLVNACRAPGEWQSYDIIFEAPRFEDGKLVQPAYATVLHNGVVAHHRQALLGRTQHKRVAKYTPHAAKGAIALQDHGNPVRYRNIWVRPLASPDGDER